MKLKLNIEDMTDGFFENTRLIGIVAPIKGYQLVWQLNNRLRFDFRSNNELEIQLTKRQRKYFFGIYEYQEPGNALQHFLYNNLTGNTCCRSSGIWISFGCRRAIPCRMKS